MIKYLFVLLVTAGISEAQAASLSIGVLTEYPVASGIEGTIHIPAGYTRLKLRAGSIDSEYVETATSEARKQEIFDQGTADRFQSLGKGLHKGHLGSC